MFNNFKKIIKISSGLKLHFFWIQFLIIIFASFQTFNLYLFKPYIDSVLKTETNIELNFFFFKIESISFFSLTILFVSTFIISSILSIFTLREVIIYSQKIGQKLKKLVFKNYISMKYQDYLGNSSADIQTLISVEIQRATSQIIQPLVFILFRIIPLIFIIIYLLILNIKITLIIISLFFFVILFALLIFKNKLNKVDFIINKTHHGITKNVLESFKNIKQVKIFKLENLFYKIFEDETKKLIYVLPVSRVVELSIKSIIEIIFILVISILFIINIKSSFFLENIALITTFFFGIYRILPGLQTIYSSYIAIKANIKSLKFLSLISEEDINKFINFETINNLVEEKNPYKFEFYHNEIDFIEIKNLNYGYKEHLIFQNQSFKFLRSNVYLIKGKSGSGKTTLVDIISGLIKPSAGEFYVNNKLINFEEYSKILNHVSSCTQKTALFNSTILENITFQKDLKNVDKNKLEQVIEICGLKSMIESLPANLFEVVVENGENFSGGQIQRLGLARSLYRDFSILILDESTSALDNNSANEIFKKIIRFYKKDKIIFFISHSEKLDHFADGKIYL